MYTLVEYAVVLMLAVLVSSILFMFSVGFMIVEESARLVGERSYRLALRLAHAVRQISTHNPASQPASSH
ncbi:MAG: hypothetical protein ACRD2O_12435 [Terriglobia bacterium]